MSLRRRLLVGLVLVALVLTATAVVVTRSTEAHLVDQVDAQLRDARPQLRGLAARPEAAGTRRLSSLYIGVLDQSDELTTGLAPDLRGDSAPVPSMDAAAAQALREGDAVTVDSDDPDVRYRMLGRVEGRQGNLTVLALPLDDVDAAIRRLIALEVMAVLAVVAVLGLVAWWVIRLGVRPVQQMTATAGAIAGGDLSHRVREGAAGTEAGDLGAALNAMLGRIEEAFDERTASEERLRRFVADASHELRTPVTTIRGYAELYRTGGLAGGVGLDEAMRRTELEAIRMGALVDDLLHLARLDQGRPLEEELVDLAAVVTDAVRDAQAAAPDRTVTATTSPAVVLGDRDRLHQVVANLLANALAHAPGAAVTVDVATDGGRAVVTVIDDGPGMTARDAARAFERFYRADESRRRDQGGSGLGLAIVDATVRAHGGSVTLDSSPGAGTSVSVELPLAPDVTP